MCDIVDQQRSPTERFLWLAKELNGIDIADLDFESIPPETTSEAVREIARLGRTRDAASLRLLPVWNDREAWKADGARTGGAWLAEHTNMAASTARERLRTAEALQRIPATSDAVASGRLGYTHAREFAKAATDEDTAEAFAHDEADLVEEAAAGRAALPTEVDLLLHSVLRRLMELDWAARHQAKSDAGASLPDDPRTHTQRLADAFDQLVQRAATTLGAPEGTYRLPEPRLIVTLDYDTLLERAGAASELATGEPLTGEAARRLACDAGISRLITKGASIVLDKGRTVRLATPAQREAVFARDGGCTGPCGGAPVDWCQIHHIREWDADHGETKTWVSPEGKRFPVRYPPSRTGGRRRATASRTDTGRDLAA